MQKIKQIKCVFLNQFIAVVRENKHLHFLPFNDGMPDYDVPDLSDNYICFVCKLVVWGKVLNAMNTSKQIFE